MNRSNYFNYIEGKLSTLAYQVEVRGKLNILDYHMHSEDFYMHLFNEIFNIQLINMNSIKQNSEGIDLIDKNKKTIIQVSSTASKQKIDHSLSMDLSPYPDFTFNFISISKDASELRKKTFQPPKKITFDPKSHIHDIPSLLKIILSSSIEKQKRIYELIVNVHPPSRFKSPALPRQG